MEVDAVVHGDAQGIMDDPLKPEGGRNKSSGGTMYIRPWRLSHGYAELGAHNDALQQRSRGPGLPDRHGPVPDRRDVCVERRVGATGTAAIRQHERDI